MATTMLRELFRPHEMDDFPGPFAHRARRVAEELREDWNRTARTAAESRRVDELHAARNDYHDLLEGHLRLLGDYLALTEVHQRAFGANPTWVEELRRAKSELQTLYDELFPRWATRDDLCRLLVEKLSLPAHRLRDLATKHAPPESWAEETDDPFSAD